MTAFLAAGLLDSPQHQLRAEIRAQWQALHFFRSAVRFARPGTPDSIAYRRLAWQQELALCALLRVRRAFIQAGLLPPTIGRKAVQP